MTAPDFDRVEEIFQKARRRDRSEWESILAEECGADAPLRAEVQELLRAHVDDRDGFLEEPALGSGFRLAGSNGVPSRIAGYEVGEKIGEGGMGVVHVAHQEHPRRTVALKLLRSGVVTDSLLRRFQREVDLLAQMKHPGIAQIHDAGVHEIGDSGVALPYLAMELIEGLPLLTYADRNALSTSARVQLFSKICDAVSYAHQRGIVHRDLKPGNILVVEVDGTALPKILDFGIARVIEDEDPPPGGDPNTLRTDPGQVLGTLQYMSPEQAAGEAVDVRTDVYSLGVVLYELLLGEHPYELGGRSLPDAVRALSVLEPRPPQQVGAIEDDLSCVVMKALEKEARRRYADARAFADDLRRHLDDQTVLARPQSGFYRLSKFTRRNRAVVFGLAAVITTLAIGVVSTTWQWRRAIVSGSAEREAREKAERRSDEVRQLATTFVFGVAERIQYIPGALEARRELLDTAVRCLEGLVRDASEDQEGRYELARAYQLVGELYGAPSLASLGDQEAALTSYSRAATIMDALEEDGYPAARLRPSRILIAESRGDLHDDFGRLDEAGREFRLAQSLSEAWCEDAPDDPRAWKALGDAEQRLANTALAARDRESVVLHLRRARDADQRRADLFGDMAGPGLRRDLAVLDFKEALALMGLQRRKEASALLDRYLETCSELMASDPNNGVYQRDVAVGMQRRGFLLQQEGELEGAIVAHSEAVRLHRERRALEGGDFQAGLDLSDSLAKLGEVLLAVDRFDLAAPVFDDFRVVADELASLQPAHMMARRHAGVARYKQFELFRARAAVAEDPAISKGHAQVAIRALGECAEMFDSLLEEGVLAESDQEVPEALWEELREYQVERGFAVTDRDQAPVEQDG